MTQALGPWWSSQLTPIIVVIWEAWSSQPGNLSGCLYVHYHTAPINKKLQRRIAQISITTKKSSGSSNQQDPGTKCTKEPLSYLVWIRKWASARNEALTRLSPPKNWVHRTPHIPVSPKSSLSPSKIQRLRASYRHDEARWAILNILACRDGCWDPFWVVHIPRWCAQVQVLAPCLSLPSSWDGPQDGSGTLLLSTPMGDLDGLAQIQLLRELGDEPVGTKFPFLT